MIMFPQQQSSEPMLISVNDFNFTKLSRKRPRSQIQHTTSEAAPVQKRQRIIKSVRFATSVENIPSSATDATDNWYNDKDSARFQANVKRDVQYLAKLCQANAVASMDRTEYCSIGLERFCCSTENRKQSKILKQRRARAIMDTQYGQRQVGKSDPEAIREAALKFSEPATKRALALAARLC